MSRYLNNKYHNNKKDKANITHLFIRFHKHKIKGATSFEGTQCHDDRNATTGQFHHN